MSPAAAIDPSADYADPLTKKERYQAIFAGLKRDRESFESHWVALGDVFSPRRVRINNTADRNKGTTRNQKIINSTGRFAARTLQSGLHAGLTSPARPWMKLTTPNQDLAEQPDVQAWLHQVTTRLMTVFATSNLYNMLPILYGDMGVFGTGAIAMLPDTRDVFRVSTFPIGSYWIGQDDRGLTSTFVREYELTVRQVVQGFGLTSPTSNQIDWSKLSQGVKDAWVKGDTERPVPITWIVAPNDSYNPKGLTAASFKWSSCHFETGGNDRQFLRESGFKQFPIMAPRWDITGEDNYGTDCPGMTALGDTNQLQSMERTSGRALAKMVDPPLQGPTTLRNQATSLLPAAVTYVDVNGQNQGLRSIHDVNLRIDHLEGKIEKVEQRIRRAFFEDLFLMLASQDAYRGSQPITAREVDERHEEKLLALGPVLERTNDELLDPLVDRAFYMLVDAGLIPPAPDALQGVDLKVEYVSVLSEAQKLIGVAAQDRFLSTVLPLAEMYPEVKAKILPFRVVESYRDLLGVDPRIIRSDDEAQGILDQAAKQQAAAQQAEQAMSVARAAKDASGAKFADGTSALDNLRDAVTPGMVQ